MENPKNLQQCLDLLMKHYAGGGWEEFKNMDEKQALSICHHTTGRALRNNWGLWDENSELYKYFKGLGIWHADDMSHIILQSFHRKINGKEIDLDRQIKYFQDYWSGQNQEDEALFEVFSPSSIPETPPAESKEESSKGLPPICRETMSMELSDQIKVTLFPEKNGQPAVDVIQLDLTQIEGKTTSLFMTPCEAMTIISALSSAVQFYLYNQEQYRKEVLEPRLEISKERQK